MDTTADAYLYAGVRMMGDVGRALDHQLLAAVVQVVLAGGVAWLLSERWQRWRQRRDFQHQLMVRFAELSGGLLNVISDLIMNFAGKDAALRQRQLLELSSMSGRMAGMASELGVLFDDPRIRQLALQLQRILTGLLSMAVSIPQAPREQCEAVQQFAIDVRQLAMVRIAREMGLLERVDPRVAKAEARGSVMPTAVNNILLAYLPASYIADLSRAAEREVTP